MAFWFVIVFILLATIVFMIMSTGRAHLLTTTRRAAADALREAQLAELNSTQQKNDMTDEDVNKITAEIDRAHSRSLRRGEEGDFRPSPPFSLSILLGITMTLAVVAYAWIGQPGAPDMGLRERAAIERPSQIRAEEAIATMNADREAPIVDAHTRALINQLQSALEERPDQSEGWRLLARSAYSIGDFQTAYQAQSEYIDRIGEAANANDYALQAEAMILATNGYISPEAETLLRQALARDNKNPVGLYYAAIGLRQQGDDARAETLFKQLLNQDLPNPDWKNQITKQLADIDEARGPSVQEIEAAAELSDDERSNMIRDMVTRLETRLAAQGGSPEDWARLINALRVLGETDRADNILQEARQKFPEAPEILAFP